MLKFYGEKKNERKKINFKTKKREREKETKHHNHTHTTLFYLHKRSKVLPQCPRRKTVKRTVRSRHRACILYDTNEKTKKNKVSLRNFLHTTNKLQWNRSSKSMAVLIHYMLSPKCNLSLQISLSLFVHSLSCSISHTIYTPSNNAMQSHNCIHRLDIHSNRHIHRHSNTIQGYFAVCAQVNITPYNRIDLFQFYCLPHALNARARARSRTRSLLCQPLCPCTFFHLNT